jgi:hypothetical protein
MTVAEAQLCGSILELGDETAALRVRLLAVGRDPAGLALARALALREDHVLGARWSGAVRFAAWAVWHFAELAEDARLAFALALGAAVTLPVLLHTLTILGVILLAAMRAAANVAELVRRALPTGEHVKRGDGRRRGRCRRDAFVPAAHNLRRILRCFDLARALAVDESDHTVADTATAELLLAHFASLHVLRAMTFENFRTLDRGPAIGGAAVVALPPATARALACAISGYHRLAVAAAQLLPILLSGADWDLALDTLPARLADTHFAATIRQRLALSVLSAITIGRLAAQPAESVLALTLALAVRLHDLALSVAAANHTRPVERTSVFKLLHDRHGVAAKRAAWVRVGDLKLNVKLCG